MRKGKKIAALLVTTTMVIGMLPMSAAAECDQHTPGEELFEADYTECGGGVQVDYYECTECYAPCDSEGNELEWIEGNGEHTAGDERLFEAMYTECGGGYAEDIYECEVCGYFCFADGREIEYTEGNGLHTAGEKVEDANFTECGGGYVEDIYECELCGDVCFADGREIEYTEGNGIHTPGTEEYEPNYTDCSGGYIEPYYECTECGEYCYANGEVAGWYVGFDDHTPGDELYEADYTESTGGYKEPYYICTVCGEACDENGWTVDYYDGGWTEIYYPSYDEGIIYDCPEVGNEVFIGTTFYGDLLDENSVIFYFYPLECDLENQNFYECELLRADEMYTIEELDGTYDSTDGWTVAKVVYNEESQAIEIHMVINIPPMEIEEVPVEFDWSQLSDFAIGKTLPYSNGEILATVTGTGILGGFEGEIQIKVTEEHLKGGYITEDDYIWAVEDGDGWWSINRYSSEYKVSENDVFRYFVMAWADEGYVFAYEDDTDISDKVQILTEDVTVDSAIAGSYGFTGEVVRIYLNLGTAEEIVAILNPGTGTEPDTEPTLGDADNNGTIDVYDARLVLRYAVEDEEAMSVINEENADYDKDGAITVYDARAILQYCVSN